MSARDAEAVKRPVRALLRGLELLERLNAGDGLTVSEAAQQARLPRTTVYRILETLCAGGFAVRDEGDDRYRPAARVRGLADGYVDEAWIQDVARPEMEAMCARILWPLMLAVVEGPHLVLRVATDQMSPLALTRAAPGRQVPLISSPAGIVRLSCADENERAALLAYARSLGASSAELGAAERAALEARSLGYALDLRVVGGEAGLAVPVMEPDRRLRAVLCMRFIRSVLEPERLTSEFAPMLIEAAARIAAAIPRDDHARAGGVCPSCAASARRAEDIGA